MPCPGHPGASPRPADIREHRARLDRGKLRRIPEQNEPGVAGKGGEHSRHEGQVHHGALVQDEGVDRPPIPGLPVKPSVHGGRVRLVPRQGRQAGDQRPVAAADRLLEPRRRLAGRRREDNPLRGGEPKLDEKGDDRGRDGGLAGAGAAGDDAEPTAGGGAHRHHGAIARVRAGEEPVEYGIESFRSAYRAVMLRPSPMRAIAAIPGASANDADPLLRVCAHIRPGRFPPRRERRTSAGAVVPTEAGIRWRPCRVIVPSAP